MIMTVSVDPVVFSNPTHMSQWYAIRSEVSVRTGWRDLRKIKPEQHRLWWEETARSTSRQLYFIRTNRQVVGIVRLDHRRTWMEAWIAVKPDHRRKGIATRALAIIEAQAVKRKWPPLGAIVNAKKNPASWNLFTRAGFVLRKKGFCQLLQP